MVTKYTKDDFATVEIDPHGRVYWLPDILAIGSACPDCEVDFDLSTADNLVLECEICGGQEFELISEDEKNLLEIGRRRDKEKEWATAHLKNWFKIGIG